MPESTRRTNLTRNISSVKESQGGRSNPILWSSEVASERKSQIEREYHLKWKWSMSWLAGFILATDIPGIGDLEVGLTILGKAQFQAEKKVTAYAPKPNA